VKKAANVETEEMKGEKKGELWGRKRKPTGFRRKHPVTTA